MLSYEEALSRVLAAADEKGRLPFSNVPSADALGRVAASDVAAPEALPAFANSAMDGFAVVAKSTPGRLKVLGALAAGDAAPAAGAGDSRSGCWEIMTGAPVPPGFDAVVRVEDVERAGSEILVRERAEAGDFVRPAGGDVRAGAPLCASGDVLDERHLMAFAALGVSKVPVRRKPRVAVISTGKELAEAGRAPRPGQIRNSSGPYLDAALRRLGAEARVLGAAGDDAGAFRALLDAAVADHFDVVLATGAVSAGRHDFVPAAIEAAGAELLFHKLAVRPGKPVLCARFGEGTFFFGLPGNPVSTAVGLRFLVAPLLGRLLGRPDEAPLRARLSAAIEKPAGLRAFLKAKARLEGAALVAQASPDQGSHQIGALLSTDGWLAVPAERERVEAGAELDFFPYWPGSLSLLPAEAAALR